MTDSAFREKTEHEFCHTLGFHFQFPMNPLISTDCSFPYGLVEVLMIRWTLGATQKYKTIHFSMLKMYRFHFPHSENRLPKSLSRFSEEKVCRFALLRRAERPPK